MGGIVDPDQRSSEMHDWISYIVKCAFDKNSIFWVYGGGNQTRDILFIDDFVDLIEMELNNFDHFSENRYALFNIGGGKQNEMSINQVIHILKKDYGLELKHEFREPHHGEPRHYYSDLGRIKQKGWPSKKLKNSKEIISDVVKHYKSISKNNTSNFKNWKWGSAVLKILKKSIYFLFR